MEVVDRYGLALALIEPKELVEEPWRSADRHIDVVRMPDPPSAVWAELDARGFVRKPSLLTWVGELGPDEEDHLSRLERTTRQDIRRARRHAAAAGLREVVEDPVSPRTLDLFLALYAERVAGMTFGVPFALDYRDAVLHGPRKFFGVFAFDGDELAGGCLVLECPAADALVLRFSAVTERWRRSSLARALYLSAMRAGRSRGYSRATLGNEPNLMGHLTRPGLFCFKRSLGFRPVPSQEFADPQGGDEADLVLSLRTLSDPALILGYAGTGREAGSRLAGRLISTAPQETAPYAAPFLESVTVHRPGEPAR